MKEIRIPVPISTADVISGANRVSASQRAYFMTGEEHFKQERLYIWENQIDPAIDNLIGLKTLLTEEDQLKLEEAITVVSNYKDLQNELDEYYETNLKDIDLKLAATAIDSSTIVLHVDEIAKQTEYRNKLNSLVATSASGKRKELRNLLMPLNNTQEEVLKSDVGQLNDGISHTNTIVIVISLGSSLLWLFVAMVIIRSLRISIEKPVNILKRLEVGELPEDALASKDELNDIIQASKNLSANLKKASDFALEIGEGRFEHEFQPSGDKDTLGNALVQMRDKLQAVATEDKKRNWITKGMADLGEILRSNENFEELHHAIIIFLVKYLDANQGAIFQVEEAENENSKLKMMACYAYGRQKFLEKEVKPGEGLIGQVYLEKKSTLLNEIPEDYVNITSGLGGAKPKSVVICPVMANETINGIIEIASFKSFEEYQIDFLEKIGEQIAAVISSIKVNIKTSHLLKESQEQAEKMRAQEEEMRQNVEELEATQEEMARKELEISAQLEAINNTMAQIEFDSKGNILKANKNFTEALKYSLEEIQGKHHRIFIDPDYANSDEYKLFWQDLANGKQQSGEFTRIAKDGSEVLISATYTPVIDREGEVTKVIKLAIVRQEKNEQVLVAANGRGK
ncbi:GAF domain-containing protein [Agaribacillus aureus]|uniref:GAF domain-containing protein n=1 Tax=Agaribacillus aureus TaxID=3051825 RepID=UPI003211ABB3